MSELRTSRGDDQSRCREERGGQQIEPDDTHSPGPRGSGGSPVRSEAIGRPSGMSISARLTMVRPRVRCRAAPVVACRRSMGRLRIMAVPAALALAFIGSSKPGTRALTPSQPRVGSGVLQPVVSPASDFNGDGFGDLAVGDPFEDVGRAFDVGGVNVIYGSTFGLVSAGNQFWDQDSSGFADLGVGVPLEDAPEDSGAVNVIYGSASGLTSARN